MNKRSVVFFATRDWIVERFYTNQISYFAENDYEIKIICKITKESNLNKIKNLKIININIDKTNTNILVLLKEIFLVNRLIIAIKPNVIINCGMKPIFISSPMSLLFYKIKIINSIIGLGTFFNNQFSILQFIVIYYFKIIFINKKNYFTVEVESLRNKISKLFYIHKDRIDVIGGVGIDEVKYIYSPTNYQKNNRIKFLVVSRLLKDKGIEELYYSIKLLSKNCRKKIEFTIIGDLDEDNPNNVSKNILDYFKSDPYYINYLANSQKINNYLKKSHILIHPSYHEGLSVICQEAVCVGRGIIASDIPGCREIVKNKYNGLLIKPKNKEDLSNKILYLLDNPANINYFNKNTLNLRNQYLKKSTIKQINIYFKKIILDV